MPKPKTVSPKFIYKVITTEFWRNSYRIEAENHGAALVMFECLKHCYALPEPERKLLGVIDPPEEVQLDGKMVYNNRPPGDDAERMLFLEMWRRMAETGEDSRTAIYVSLKFICAIKKWDPDLMLEEVRRCR
jgi:hypothetical protein